MTRNRNGLACCVLGFLGLNVVAGGCANGDRGPTGGDSGTHRDGGSPDGESEFCVDDDGDGYGEDCVAGEDCDDTDPTVSPAATEECDGIDNDCDEDIDEDVAVEACALTEGVCAGATAECGGIAGFTECDGSAYGADYEDDETSCDELDNDCDGMTDEDCGCTSGDVQECGSDTGECALGMQTCDEVGAWGLCDGDAGPMGESCDGLDNDCDGPADEPEDLVVPDCPLRQGVCAGSQRACGGAAGWLACSGAESYGPGYEATETACDAVDNDCDGIIDEVCACFSGDTRPCGTDVGACVAGLQTCIEGNWGACTGEVRRATETCNGADDDCDGDIDDAVVVPPCALGSGVCAGSRQVCAGVAGFVACAGSESYGSGYEATETSCDGLDNDCDGDVDEACPCVVGATQVCGAATGACELGMQTCAASGWGACAGSVAPAAEICNGFDDDCNGITDDDLTVPTCALVVGVCADARQVCGGSVGWVACTADSYGTSYMAVETGATTETICDGLDNDCDGTVDEDCASGPVATDAGDALSPSIYHNHVAYLSNPDGNYDVFLLDLRTGTTEQLTHTTDGEGAPHVYGNLVAFTRGVEAASRVIVYDLVTETERVLTTAEAHAPQVFEDIVVWQDHRGASSDVYGYNLRTATEVAVAATSANEEIPQIRNDRILYVSDATGLWHLRLQDVEAGTDTELHPTSASNEVNPKLDWSVVGWNDSRSAVEPFDAFANWDIFGALTSALTTERTIATESGAQLLSALDGAIFVWSDHSGGNWNIAARLLDTGTPLVVTTSDAHQGDPAISGDVVVWMDNRLGTFDIYGSALSPIRAPVASEIRIQEALADPPAAVDVNGDGSASTTQDEFVELLNATDMAADISGFALSDGFSLRHTFPAGSVIPAGGALVVFSGGVPAGRFGGVTVQTASSGALGLNNDGDTLTLRALDGSTVIDTVTYGSEGGMDESLERNPIRTGALARHSTIAGAVGRYSPGVHMTGYAY